MLVGLQQQQLQQTETCCPQNNKALPSLTTNHTVSFPYLSFFFFFCVLPNENNDDDDTD